MATECFCLVITDESDLKNFYNLGEYLIEWRRTRPHIIRNKVDESVCKDSDEEDDVTNDEVESNNNVFYTNTIVNLPQVNIESFPFLIETNLPTHGALDRHLTIVYKIRNKTNYSVLDIECTLDENESFSIAGNKLVCLIKFTKRKYI